MPNAALRPASAAQPLRAARPAGGLAGRLRVPGDRSIGHRALLLGALAVGRSEIAGLPEGEEMLRTAAALRALGARVERLGEGHWQVWGRGIGGLVEPAEVLEMGHSGAAAPLFCGLLAGHPVFAVLTGDAALRARPMGWVTEPLAATGARFTTRAGGLPPLAIEGAAQPLPLEHRLPVASAAVKSALLLAGLCARGTTRLEEPEASPDHMENLLRHFGAVLRVGPQGQGRVIELEGQPELVAASVRVPADPSLAAFPLLAALLVPGSRLRLEGVGLNPLRTGFLAALREMGAALAVENERLEGGEPVGDITATHGPLRGVDVPAAAADLPILAVAAAFARGTTRLRGPAGPGLAATLALLAANGVEAGLEGEDLVLHRDGHPPPGGGLVATGLDHRIAMGALVLGLAAAAPVAIEDARGIGTAFPGFVASLNGAAGGSPITPLEQA